MPLRAPFSDSWSLIGGRAARVKASLSAHDESRKPLRKRLSRVAGAGFEPATFGL